MYRTYGQRAAFAFVYIAEAHAIDEWQVQSNLDDGALLHQHRALEERFAAAREGVRRLDLTLPVLVDPMDDAVSETFAAWPERIYIADGAGRLTYVGGPGPWEFSPAAAAEALADVV